MANEDKIDPRSTHTGANRHRVKIGVAVILILTVAIIIYWWVFVRNYESTDDAYARADNAIVSVRVSGNVLKLFVDNDFAVQVGQPLFDLDPADYEVAVDKAQAALDADEAILKGAEIMVPPVNVQTSSQVRSEEAMLKAAQDTESQTRHNLQQIRDTRDAAAAEFSQAERDYKRFESLSAAGAGTERQSEQARTAYDKAKAQLKAVDAQIASLESALSAATQQVNRARAQLQSAVSGQSNVEVQLHRVEELRAKRDKSKADLDTARLNLSYCKVVAPIDGYIAQRSVQIGDRLQPGQAVMAVVPLKRIYIEANYKETQLTDVRIGQPALISADIYPGYQFKGKVFGIRAGTGAAFSLIPPENATGNWIKVVQRIPVRIELDQPPPQDHPLRVGTSMVVTISIADRSGPYLQLTTPAMPTPSTIAPSTSQKP